MIFIGRGRVQSERRKEVIKKLKLKLKRKSCGIGEGRGSWGTKIYI